MRNIFLYKVNQELNMLAISLLQGSGSAQSICQGIREFTDQRSISLESLIAIGCDGTNVNTGTKGGIIRLIGFF